MARDWILYSKDKKQDTDVHSPFACYPTCANRQEKRHKGIQLGKEVKLSLFTEMWLLNRKFKENCKGNFIPHKWI